MEKKGGKALTLLGNFDEGNQKGRNLKRKRKRGNKPRGGRRCKVRIPSVDVARRGLRDRLQNGVIRTGTYCMWRGWEGLLIGVHIQVRS